MFANLAIKKICADEFLNPNPFSIAENGTNLGKMPRTQIK